MTGVTHGAGTAYLSRASELSIHPLFFCWVSVSQSLVFCVVYLFDGVQRHFQQYLSYLVAVSFIVGGNGRTRRKPPTCRKSLTNFITKKTHNVVHLALIEIRTHNISGDRH